MLSHDEPWPAITALAARNLWRQGQELFIEEALGVEVREQTRPALDENPFSGTHPAHRLENGVR